MRTFRLVIMALLACGPSALAGDVAPSGTLRAVYLGTNPAQAMRDPATGQVRGPAYDLARELARRDHAALEFKPIAGPPAVIEAVMTGDADIGFVAYEATRLGTVEFSQIYMLVRQSFLVLDGSSIKAIADIDRAGQKIAGTVNDSITLCMKRILRQATVVELENNPAELSKALTARTVDALGANRQRLTTIATATPGTRLLPDDLFNVPQNIVVPKDRPAALAAVNALTPRACCRVLSSAAAPSGSR
jgi:polar amino acid transport system substrate-binding protein